MNLGSQFSVRQEQRKGYPDSLPSVSIIIVNYNGLAYLKDCLDSIYALAYPQDLIEIILVDNASTDGSVAFVRERYPKVRIIQNERNLGFAEPNNIGARQAKGEFIALLNNDMRVAPDWLTELAKPALASTDVACIGSKILDWSGKYIDFAGGVLNFHGHGGQIGFGELNVPETENREILFACGGAMLVKRDVFLDIGGFDGDFFAYYEDVDFGWRLWILGYRVLYALKSVAYHRRHGTAKGFPHEKRLTLFEKNALSMVIKNYDDENLQRILPAALLLAVKRAFIYSGLDRKDYLFNADQSQQDSHDYSPVEPKQPMSHRIRYYSRAATRIIRHRGLFKGLREICARAREHIVATGAPVPQFSGHATTMVPKFGLSPIVAISEIMDDLPVLLEKRQRIQAQRRRSDAEILPLFLEPERLPYLDLVDRPSYHRAVETVQRYFHILDIFRIPGRV